MATTFIIPDGRHQPAPPRWHGLQQPNPFPKSIFDNVAFGMRINGLVKDHSVLVERVEQALRHAALWDVVKDRLQKSAMMLSAGTAASVHRPRSRRPARGPAHG